MVANIGSVAVEVRKIRLNTAERTQFAGAYLFQHAQPLGMEANHEGFHDVDLVGHFAQFCGLTRVQRDRLFTQNVFSGTRCRERHGDVFVVWKRVVDRLNFGVGQQFFVAAVGVLNAQSVRQSSGFVKLP